MKDNPNDPNTTGAILPTKEGPNLTETIKVVAEHQPTK